MDVIFSALLNYGMPGVVVAALCFFLWHLVTVALPGQFRALLSQLDSDRKQPRQYRVLLHQDLNGDVDGKPVALTCKQTLIVAELPSGNGVLDEVTRAGILPSPPAAPPAEASSGPPPAAALADPKQQPALDPLHR